MTGTWIGSMDDVTLFHTVAQHERLLNLIIGDMLIIIV